MPEHTSILSQPQIAPAAIKSTEFVHTPVKETIYTESLCRLPIQRKLSIGAVDDPLEDEADAMADKAMRMPEPSFIQRKCSHCEEEAEQLQRKPLISFIQKKERGNNNTIVSESISNQIQATKGSGKAIPETTKSFMESRFGADFSNVNIHTGSYASQLSNQLNAQAFTVGSDIYFNDGKYQPESTEGKLLMAHELTHVIQQQAAGFKHLQTFRGPMPVRPPMRAPVRVPVRPPTGTAAPSGDVSYVPGYIPDPYDNSWDAMQQRYVIRNYRDNMMLRLEKPAATTIRGGKAPGFISEGPEKYYDYFSDVDGGGRIYYKPHYFHLLDKIEYDIESVKNEDSLIAVFVRYHSMANLIFNFLDAKAPSYEGYKIHNAEKLLPPISWGINYPPTLDRELATTTLRSVAAKKAKQLGLTSAFAMALEESEQFVLQSRKRSQGPCSYKKTPQIGNNRHKHYATHVAATKGYGIVTDELTYQTPEGIIYPFDTYNPSNLKDVWEVKTLHDWTSDVGMANAPYVPGFLERIIKLDTQRLRGIYVAERCGLSFKYAFDNCAAALGMRNQWNNIPTIEYIAYPGDPIENCR